MAKATQYNRTVVLDENRFWYGHCIGDIPNGIGIIYEGRPGLTLTKRQVLYHGEMKDGKYHGKGTFTSRDKTLRYSGYYKDHQYHGEGVLHFLNEDGLAFSYNGSFKEGKKDGQGTLKYLISYEQGVDEKVIYSGGWKNDERDGEGKLYIYNDEGFRLAKATGIWQTIESDFNVFNGKIIDSRSGNLIIDGCASVPLLGNGIEYEFHYGTEYNNKIVLKDYYDNNELISSTLEIPFKKFTKMIHKTGDNICDLIFDLVIKVKINGTEEECNAKAHFRFDIKYNEYNDEEELHLIMNHIEVPKKKMGYIYHYYNTSDGHNGTFCYKKGNTFEYGKFDKVEQYYELIVTMSKSMNLLDFDMKKMNNYKHNFHSYDISFAENNTFQPGELFHGFGHNPIRDENCYLNRTSFVFGNVNKEIVFRQGRIKSIFYPCMNMTVNHVHYEDDRILKEFVIDDRKVIIDTKYPNNKIIKTKDNTILDMKGDKYRCIFSKHKGNMLKAVSNDAKKLVYRKIKHSDMEIYVESDYLYLFSFNNIEPKFWMNYKNYFENEYITFSYVSKVKVNFRRTINDGTKVTLIDFMGIKDLDAEECTFNGKLSVNKAYIDGIFDKYLNTHGFCKNFSPTEKGLIVHQGKYEHGELVKPKYIGYVNDSELFHGKGTLYTNGNRVRYTGLFNNGKLFQGNKYENDLLTYRGFFKDLLYHGKGTEFFPDGTKNVGTFEFGVFS